jgi:hypothetical protein
VTKEQRASLYREMFDMLLFLAVVLSIGLAIAGIVFLARGRIKLSELPATEVQTMNKVTRCVSCIITGIAVSLCPAFLLLWIYAWSMVPAGPDYYSDKIRFMFSMPDPGIATWLGVLGLIPGVILICMGSIALFRADANHFQR